MVGRVIADEIGRGEGANFVIKRRFQARIDGYATASALSFFRQLLLREKAPTGPSSSTPANAPWSAPRPSDTSACATAWR
ncbi:hypothetical protein BH77_00385 [Pseudomonas aeruginosa C2773C]|nr:hypothetical protein BH77_00385 [Pseudomonas aeruginosa C2773C]